MLFNRILVPVAGVGWGAALLAGWLYLGARDAIIEEREGCMVEELQQQLEGARNAIARQNEIHAEWRSRMERTIAEEHAAREYAEGVAGAALMKLRESMELLDEVEDACLDYPADTALLDSLRD